MFVHQRRALLTKIAQHPELVKCDPHGGDAAKAEETARCAALIFGEDLAAVGGVARNYGFEQLSRPDLAGKVHALLQVLTTNGVYSLLLLAGSFLVLLLYSRLTY